MKKLFLAALSFSSSLCLAQTLSLHGRISDGSNGDPIPAVSVVAIESGKGCISDPEGQYSMVLPNKKQLIRYTALGYQPDSILLNNSQSDQSIDLVLYPLSYELDVVTITGGKYAKKLSEEISSLEVLKAAVIQNSNSQLNEAVNKVPGVSMIGDNISIRGGSGFSDGASSRVGILVDDMPLLGSDDGGITWQAMPVESVDQVEILKGAGSALYGSASLNGVINVRTADAAAEDPYVKMNFNAGAYQRFGKEQYTNWWDSLHQKPYFADFNMVYRERFKWADISIGAAYHQDGSYQYADAKKYVRTYGKLRHINKKKEGLSYGVNMLVYHSSGQEFFIWRDTGSRILFPQEIMSSYERDVSFNPYLRYIDTKGNQHTTRLKYYNRNSGTQSGTEYSDANQLYADYTYNRNFEKEQLVLTTGLSGYFNFITSEQFGDIEGGNLAAFCQLDKKVFKRLSLSFGIRTEYNKADTIKRKNEIAWLTDLFGKSDSEAIRSAIVPVLRGGFNLEIIKGTNFRASYGQGFRYPTMAELFTDVVRSGIHVYPNTQLRAESGWTAEAGLKQGLKLSRWIGYFDLSGFISRYHDMTEFTVGVFGSPPSLGAQAQNVEEAQISGFEASMFSQGKVFKVPLNILAGYSYIQPVDLTILQNYDSVFYLKYRNHSSLKLDVDVTAKKVSFGTSLVYTSRMLQIDPFVEAVGHIYAYRAERDKGHVVLDARLAYNFSQAFKVSVIAKNLLNTEYFLRPGKLEAPRSFTLQLSYEI